MSELQILNLFEFRLMFYFDVASIMPQKTVRRQRKRTVPRGVVKGSFSESEDIEFNEFDLDTASSEVFVGDAPNQLNFHGHL